MDTHRELGRVEGRAAESNTGKVEYPEKDNISSLRPLRRSLLCFALLAPHLFYRTLIKSWRGKEAPDSFRRPFSLIQLSAAMSLSVPGEQERLGHSAELS